jgi:outer membrane protein OmpA-like peptidoglycan-associated protein
MKSKVVVLLVGSLLATSGWTAEKNRAAKEESIGVGSGAAIGAIAGGPVGLIIGAAFGGWLGDRFHHERSERLASERQVGEAQAQTAALQTRLGASERAIGQMDAELYNERVAHRRDLTEALSVEVFFRTEDSGIAADTERRLATLAALVAPMEGAVIRLEGHADARGTEAYNAQLSVARAEAVRDALVRAGLPAERIVVSAVGESDSTAAEQDADGMALERRVRLHVVDLDDSSRVARQTLD